MKRFGLGLLYAIGGYLLAAVAGYLMIEAFSSNTHDRSVEAAMTSALVVGPVGALLAFIAGFMRGGSTSSSRTSTEV